MYYKEYNNQERHLTLYRSKLRNDKRVLAIKLEAISPFKKFKSYEPF